MRRHAKASTAGSTKPRAKGLGRFFRGAFSVRDASSGAKGTGAPAAGRFVLPAGILVVLLSLPAAATPAAAVAASPVVTTTAVTNNTGVHATLNGTVNPEGEELSECKFEWGKESAFDKVAPCAESNATIGSGTSPVAVHADISNLQPNGAQQPGGANYRFRLVAKNPTTAAVEGGTQFFITPNTVITTAATGTTTTSTTLNGTVNPDGVAMTDCEFEWGPEKPFYELTQTYPNTAPCVPNAAGIGSGISPVAVSASLSGLSIGTVYHYRLKAANANGQILGLGKSVQTTGPVLKGTWSESVTFTEATLRAKINPEGLATTYRFQWGTSTSYGNETTDKSVGSDSADHTVTAFLEGLQPGTTYHYRVIATNSTATNEGPDTTFTTFEPFAPDTNCANQVFRFGAAANLADCRAYEMVSPVDKNGGDIKANFVPVNSEIARIDKAAISGNKFTYSSYQAFGDSPSSRYASQYLASRGAGGWSNHGISTPLGEVYSGSFHLPSLFTGFEAFSEDLSTAWIFDDNKVPLTPDATGTRTNWYWRDNTDDSYHFVAPFPEPNANVEPMIQGYTADRSQMFFHDQPGFNGQLYDVSEGEVHQVSVLPDGTSATAGLLGSGNSFGSSGLHAPNVSHAVSEDGSRVFWTQGSEEGKLFVRENPSEEQSAFGGGGECTEPAKACTVPISESVDSENTAKFWSATPDGSKVLFSFDADSGGNGNGAAEDDLYEFNVDTRTASLVAHEVTGVVGVSDDLSYIYFLSKDSLAAGATAGKANLYLSRDGTMTFIANPDQAGEKTVNGENAVSGYSIGSLSRLKHGSRVTPDGHRLVFQSRQSLTGYDNTDANNGEADVEIFTYDADLNQLTCVSCNPSGARPVGKPALQPFSYLPVNGGINARQWTAAWIPNWEYSLNSLHPLSEDGNRLFFNSFDALLPGDTNGMQDVYEWEPQGVGSCGKAAGCLSLISSGQSPTKSEFIDASPDGRDVFFETQSSLVPQDPGLIDIYDARSGGGFPAPPSTPECIGDACQTIPSAPNDATPASAGFRGAGDPTPRKAKPRCRARNRHAGSGKHRTKSKQTKRCKRNNRRAGR